jgi:hypothetical protein
MAKWVNEGENRVANQLFGATAVDSALYFGLYTDVTEPGETATLSSITEVDGAGYERKTLARGSWTIADAIASYAEQTFSASGSWGAVTGSFIATSSDNSGKLLAVQNFAEGSFNMVNGSTLKQTPKITVA